jgi:hypothetical protein
LILALPEISIKEELEYQRMIHEHVAWCKICNQNLVCEEMTKIQESFQLIKSFYSNKDLIKSKDKLITK